MVRNKITEKSTLRAYESDFRGEIKPSFILGLFQEVAGEHADEMGLGFADLRAKGCFWVLSKIYVEICDRPKHRDEVTVETWPHTPGKAIYERSFVILRGGKVAVRALSRWCILQDDNYRIVPSARLPQKIESFIEERSVGCEDWQIPTLGEDRPAFTVMVANADYDENRHVNNIRYADYVFDCFSVAELESRKLKNFQMHYLQQSHEGDALDFYRKEVEKNIFVVEGRRGKDVVIAARICFSEV